MSAPSCFPTSRPHISDYSVRRASLSDADKTLGITPTEKIETVLSEHSISDRMLPLTFHQDVIDLLEASACVACIRFNQPHQKIRVTLKLNSRFDSFSSLLCDATHLLVGTR